MLRWLIPLVFLPVLLTASPVEGEFSCSFSAFEGSETRESALHINANIRYQRKTFFVDFNPQAQYSFHHRDSTEYTFSFLGEYYFDWGGVCIHSVLNQSQNIFRRNTYGSAEIFRTIDEAQCIIEYGSAFSINNYPDYNAFDHVDNTTYLIYKKFYRRHAFHANFDFGYRYLNNATLHPLSMCRTSSSVFISRGLRRNIGLKYGLYISYVITSTDSLLYPDTDLYDIFAYNKYSLYLESTMYFNNLLLKPGLSYVYKEYASSTREEYPYTSHVILTLYADYPLMKKVLIFTNDWFSLALNDTDNPYFASLGLRYIF